jgi:glycosyltransferase involved in cell wall biosynthesis
MNIALVFDNSKRFWTVGSYIEKVLVRQSEINIVARPCIPEDTGILEEQCGRNIDLICVIDCAVHYKLHHHTGKLGKAKTCAWISDLHRKDWAEWRLQMIKEFKYDHIFYAQKKFKQMILDCGYTEQTCSWLPHAVDSEIFRPMPWIEKKYDCGYVGYCSERRDKAEKVLGEMMKFKHFDSCWAWAANRALQECKIGFNYSVEDTDICNMRVFETLAAGVPLLTNFANDSGLEELFGTDYENKMLVYKDKHEMKEKAVRLLANPDLRKQLAENGRTHTLMHHTYRNRCNTILATCGFEMLKNY